MNFFQKNKDTLSIISVVITSMIWMNFQFKNIDYRFAEIEKDLAIIKTVLIMRNIMPSELVHENKKESAR